MQNETSGQDIEQQPNQDSTSIPLLQDQPSSTPAGGEGNKSDTNKINNLENLIESTEKRLMIFLTAAMAFFALCGVGVAVLQWKTMNGQLEEMRSQFQRDQRPYVMPTKVEPFPFAAGKPIMVNLRWVNYGKSPAIKVSGRSAIFFGANALEQADRWFELIEASKPLTSIPERIVPPGVPADLKEAEFSTLSSIKAITQEELNFLTSSNFSIAVVIRQVYFDSAGNRYWTDSCFSNLATMAMPDCPKHNEIH
jgi:hypothetical protein